MTLPFENDTNSFIKKLASAQLKKERLKKIFTIIAISLATFLMASVLLLVSGIITVNQNGGNNITGSYHALISSIEKEQYQKLSDDVRVDLCGFTASIGSVEMSRKVQSGNTQNLKGSAAPVRLPAAPASTPGTSQAATQAGCVYRP